MANLGQVTKDNFIYDPFVGTGSLLIPPSFHGCYAYGSDIDIRVLKGYGVGYTKKKKKKDEKLDIFTNFAEYGLKKPNILRCDINNPVFRFNEVFDAIICDPPYGHRAFTRITADNDDIILKSELKKKKIDEIKTSDKEVIEVEIKSDLKNNIIERSSGNEESKEFLNKKIENETSDSILINLKDDNKVKTKNKKLTNEYYISSDSSEESKEKKSESLGQYFIPLHQCDVEKIYENLLNIGKLCLRKGGLLVCLYPFKKTIE